MLKEELENDQVLVIGDTPLDIRCGRAIGAQVLAVATGGATLSELEAHKPERAVRDLRSLPRDDLSQMFQRGHRQKGNGAPV